MIKQTQSRHCSCCDYQGPAKAMVEIHCKQVCNDCVVEAGITSGLMVTTGDHNRIKAMRGVALPQPVPSLDRLRYAVPPPPDEGPSVGWVVVVIIGILSIIGAHMIWR